MPDLTDPPVPDDDAVHRWFGLSYANYLVLPRTLLQSMPAEWQRRFVGCLEELDAAFAGEDRADSYEVVAGTEHYVNELDDATLARVGITREGHPHAYLGGDGIPDFGPAGIYRDAAGTELPDIHRVVVPYPAGDPTPHYNRGRARVDPDLEAVARVRAERPSTVADPVLAVEMSDNDAGAATIGDYLVALLGEVWASGEGFSGKRPFGNSGWEHDLYLPLVRAGLVRGEIVDGYLEDYDRLAARALITRAIRALRSTPKEDG